VIRKLAVGVAAAALLGFAGIPAASAASSNQTDQTITYQGYEIQVPGNWPVYDLSADPTRCVLMNQHAVYLGTPGANQQCPPRAFGKTEAVLIQPEPSSVPAGTVQLGSDTAAFTSPLTAAETTTHTIQFTAPGPGVQVTATYGNDLALISTILAGAQITAKTSAPAPTVTTSPQAAHSTPSTSGTGHAATGEPSKGTQGATSGLSAVHAQGLGIDTCTVPSLAAMSDVAQSPYKVISTYLGGANWACTYGDFNADWVGQVAAMGIDFTAIWVGPQASCTTLTGTTVIDPANAAAQGEAEAASAVAAAQEFGYGAGIPIYYDMESYNNSDASCSQATLTFLGAWTTALHDAGYKSGVYSSAATGIADLASQYANTAFASPDDVWFADWNNNAVLTNPYLTAAEAADWQGATMHQYTGPHDETWGKTTLNVDSDIVDAEVAGDPNAQVTGQPTVTDEPAEVAVAPGSHSTTQLQIQATSQQLSTVQWKADPPAGVLVSPSSGTAIVAGNGRVTISLNVIGAPNLAAGRHVVPITETANGKPITETFLLVSDGSSVASSVVLYAADASSMAIAETEAHGLALPTSNLTGNFETAWNDASSGSYAVIAVGTAASNALFHNACGWPNPINEAPDHTPFGLASIPLQGPASGVFEAADGSTDAATQALSEQYAQYALAGTVPNESAAQPLGSITPANTCLGSPDVPVQ